MVRFLHIRKHGAVDLHQIFSSGQSYGSISYFNVMVMGIPKLQSGKQEDLVFGIINLFILTPIIVGGLLMFGYYALKDEYIVEK